MPSSEKRKAFAIEGESAVSATRKRRVAFSGLMTILITSLALTLALALALALAVAVKLTLAVTLTLTLGASPSLG